MVPVFAAYYFNGGKFTGENAGFTHIDMNASVTTFSAYRMHMTDPVTFRDGFRMDWRNGDVSDPATGLKCTQLKGASELSPHTSHAVQGFFLDWAFSVEGLNLSHEPRRQDNIRRSADALSESICPT